MTELVAGAVAGFVIGWAGSWIVNRLYLSASGLRPILVLSIGLMTFGFRCDWRDGFLAVYVCGVTIGNRISSDHDGVLRFHDAAQLASPARNVHCSWAVGGSFAGCHSWLG